MAESRRSDSLGGDRGAGPIPVRYGTELGMALLVVIWGVNFAVVKRALEVFEPLGFNALRFLIASLFVWLVLRAQGRIQMPAREDWLRFALLGLGGNVVYQIAFIQGLNLTRAGNASVMLALVPVFVLMLSVAEGERRSRRSWAGAVLSFVGIALVSGSSLRLEGTETLIGDGLIIGAAVAWAFYTVAARPLLTRYGSIATTAWSLWIGAIGIFLVGVPSLLSQEWSDVGPFGWGGLLYSAILSIGLAYLIWYRGVERLGSATTAIFGNTTPLIALAVGALWLGETLTILSVLGAVAAVGGVVLVRQS